MLYLNKLVTSTSSLQWFILGVLGLPLAVEARLLLTDNAPQHQVRFAICCSQYRQTEYDLCTPSPCIGVTTSFDQPSVNLTVVVICICPTIYTSIQWPSAGKPFVVLHLFAAFTYCACAHVTATVWEAAPWYVNSKLRTISLQKAATITIKGLGKIH